MNFDKSMCNTEETVVISYLSMQSRLSKFTKTSSVMLAFATIVESHVQQSAAIRTWSFDYEYDRPKLTRALTI